MSGMSGVDGMEGVFTLYMRRLNVILTTLKSWLRFLELQVELLLKSHRFRCLNVYLDLGQVLLVLCPNHLEA